MYRKLVLFTLLVTFALLMLAELAVSVFGFGRTVAEHLATYRATGAQLGLAALAGLHPQLANLIGYGAAVVIGYVSHSAFTFRGHGTRDKAASRGIRFVAVSLVSYALNALWVWLCVTHMGWPEWSPIPAMIFVTPAVMFGLNRQWVFK